YFLQRHVRGQRCIQAEIKVEPIVEVKAKHRSQSRTDGGYSRRGKRFMAIIAASLLPGTVWAQTGNSPAAGLPALVNLSPGSDLRIRQNVDVNVVLIGFGGLVDPATLLAQPHLRAWNGVPKANGSGQ